MKKIKRFLYFKNKSHHKYWLAVVFVILTSYSFAQGKSSFNEMITLNTENAPLAEVLDDVSQSTGYELIVDENWSDLPITVKFDAMPLDQALKRILAKVNHAIIYSSDRKILIRIYENDSTVSMRPGVSTIIQKPRTPVYTREIDNSASLDSSPNPVSDVQDESEASESVSSQRENEEKEDDDDDEEKEDEEDENKNSDEDTDAENQK